MLAPRIITLAYRAIISQNLPLADLANRVQAGQVEMKVPEMKN